MVRQHPYLPSSIHSGDLHTALTEYQAAIAIDEPRVTANPSDARARLDLTYGYSDIGLILRGLGRFPEALQQYRKAGKIRAEAAAGLGTTTMRIADLLAAMGDRRQAASHRSSTGSDQNHDRKGVISGKHQTTRSRHYTAWWGSWSLRPKFSSSGCYDAIERWNAPSLAWIELSSSVWPLWGYPRGT